jgi:hypothetical protein
MRLHGAFPDRADVLCEWSERVYGVRPTNYLRYSVLPTGSDSHGWEGMVEVEGFFSFRLFPV